MRPKPAGLSGARRSTASVLLPLFVLSLALPMSFDLGGMRLSPYRVFLVVAFIPCTLAWLSGRCGPLRLADLLVLGSAAWGGLALTVNHGAQNAWQPSGILLVETFGAYVLARTLIRGPEDFRAMARIVFLMICVFIPFAAFESLTDMAPLMRAVGAEENYPAVRLGLFRSQVAFEHPILYGVFCASGFGLAYYALGSGPARASSVFRACVVTLATFFSLSAGPLLALMVQVLLAGWDHVTRTVRKRWRLFALLGVAGYVVIDLLSNRTPVHVLISYLTFNSHAAYMRIHIWAYGTAEVMRNPLFGTGFADWQRATWMSDSIDNFWLLLAVRYGLPAFVCLAAAILLVMRALGRLDPEDAYVGRCRSGLLVSLAGLVIAACTVHYWNAIYCWMLFLLGSGMWMLREPAAARPADGDGRERARRPNRFAARKGLGAA